MRWGTRRGSAAVTFMPLRVRSCVTRTLVQGCIRREGASEAAQEAVRQTVGGGCQSGWGRLLSVTNALKGGTWRQGGSGWE